MNDTLVILLIGIFVYGVVIAGPAITRSRIAAAKDSSGAKLRTGILHLILCYGSICVSQLSVFLGKPMKEIEIEIDILKRHGIIVQMEKDKVKPKKFNEDLYVFPYKLPKLGGAKV